MATHEDQRYVVSILGENANWVRNVRGAHGRATLRRKGAEAVRLVEVPVRERAPILRSYLDAAPGARPHIPVDRHASRKAFEQIANQYPALRIVPTNPRQFALTDPSPPL